MPVRPVEYHPFQYPRKYRPLGYGSWEPPAPPPPEPVSPRRRRRTVALILAALVATVVIHAGIAAAYVDDGGSANPAGAPAEETAPRPAQCDDPQDAFNDPEFQDVGASGVGASGSTPDDADALRRRL